MKISKSKLRQIIKEELGTISEARDKRLRPSDPGAWELEKSITMGAPYPDEEALELFQKVSRLYHETGISNRFGRLLPDKGADDVNAFFVKRAKYLQIRDDEKNADLPRIIWDYGGRPGTSESIEWLREKWDYNEEKEPDSRYYSTERDFKSGIIYWERKDEFDLSTKGNPFDADESGLQGRMFDV